MIIRKKIAVCALLLFFGKGIHALPNTENLCLDGTEIHRIVLEGLVHTRPIVVERELALQIGRPFSQESLEASERAWLDLDLFAEVQPECLPDTISRKEFDGSINRSVGMVLTLHFIELFQYIPSPSVKQSDQDGWMIGGALAALNLFGYDIRTEVQARGTASPWLRAKEFAFYSASPYVATFPMSWKTELIRADSWDPLRSFHDRSWNGEFDAFHVGKKHRGALLTGGFRLLEHDLDDSLPWLGSHRSEWVPRLGLALLWDSRDATMYTRRGIYNELRVTQNGGWLGGPANYLEFLWDAQGSTPIGPGVVRTGFFTRLRPGDIGFYDRLHQGGANTLRGFYPDSSVFGFSEMIVNAEWRQPVVHRSSIRLLGLQGFWGLEWVAGYDGAWLWDQGTPHWSDYRDAFYAGVHLLVPAIERVRFEIGGDPRTQTWAFTIGLFEKAATQRWRSR